MAATVRYAKHKACLILLLSGSVSLLCVFLQGCGGGGGGGTPPSNLLYPQTSITATVGTAIATDTPTVIGTVDSYTISPTPPSGLSLNSSTGAISGTPTVASAQAMYTVTARNSAGFTSATIQIVVNPSVAISPSSAAVPLGGSQQFTATVSGDPSNGGVSWSLVEGSVTCVDPGTCSPAVYSPCSSVCGTLSAANTASGGAVTYTAPTHFTSPPNPCGLGCSWEFLGVFIQANLVRDSTIFGLAQITFPLAVCGGSGSESLLKGQYAFLLRGFDQRGEVVAAGSFAADGNGKITGGEEDSNSALAQQNDIVIDSARSSYSVGPDRRGCLALGVTGGPTTFYRFALGSLNPSNIATKGRVIEFGDTEGTGTRADGTIVLQDSGSFAASQFKGTYVIGLNGADGRLGRLALAGIFAADGASAVSSGALDINDAGTVTSDVLVSPAGSFTCCTSNGRGTLTLQISTSNFTPSFAFYMINGSEAFLVNSGSGQFGGQVFGVAIGTIFAQTSLNGVSVLRQTGQSAAGPVVDIATVSSDGTGAMTVDDNRNAAGSFTSSSTRLNYIVDSNGRVTLSGGTVPPVIYLYGPNEGFFVDTDSEVTFGFLEPQAAGPFSNASFSGAYIFGTENSSNAGTVESGIVTADGNGNAPGTLDQSSPTGVTQNQSFNFVYSISTGGTGNVGSNTTALMISASKLVLINNTNPNPTIAVVEK